MNALMEFLLDGSAACQFTLLTLKSSVLALLGLLLYRLLHRASASTRHLALGASLLAIVLLPIIGAVSPMLTLPIDTVETVTAATDNIAAMPAAIAPAAQPAPSATFLPAESRPMTSGDALLAIYLAGVAGVLLYLAAGLLRVALINRRSIDASDDPLWREIVSPACGRRTPQLRITRGIAAPLTWGVMTPTILLPATAADWSTEDRRNAMLHELAHVERRDWLTHVLARVVCAVYWFNPLVWIAAQKLDLEAEHAADDSVLRSGSSPDAYAEQLLTLTRLARQQTFRPVAAAPMAGRRRLGRRVASILNTGENRMPVNRFAKFVLLSHFAAAALLIGSTQLVAAQDDESYAAEVAGPVPPLHAAGAEGNYGEAARLIGEGADINKTLRRSFGPFQRSALGTAARAGNTDIAELLIRSGADVNRVVRGDATALIEALRFGHEETVAMLIENGADVNLTARGDGSPLIAATAAGNADMARLLLNRGANPDTWVSGDENPIYHAARTGNLDIMQMLIDAGVDVNRMMPGDGNALMVAIRNGHNDVADLLIAAGARGDAGIEGDGNALIAAAQRGDVALLQRMIATGADVNAAVEGDGSPLIAASRNRRLDAAMLLVNNGADVNLHVFGDETPLIGAAWEGDVEMVNYLLSVGADPTFRAKTYLGRSRSALSQATREGHTEVIEILKAAGAEQ